MPKNEELLLSKLQTQRLCELYQEEEPLWNVRSPNYFKKDIKTRALNRIKCALEGEFDDIPNFTVDLLWKKLANLRSYYAKELKKVNDSKKRGTCIDSVYVSNWSHYGVLDNFLRAHVIPRKSTPHMEPQAQNDYEEDDADDCNNDTASQISEKSTENCQTPIKAQTERKRKIVSPENLMQDVSLMLNQSKSRCVETPPQKEEDEHDIFGKHVACEMRKIKDPWAVGIAKLKIQSVLFEAQFNAEPTSSVEAIFQSSKKHAT